MQQCRVTGTRKLHITLPRCRFCSTPNAPALLRAGSACGGGPWHAIEMRPRLRCATHSRGLELLLLQWAVAVILLLASPPAGPGQLASTALAAAEPAAAAAKPQQGGQQLKSLHELMHARSPGRIPQIARYHARMDAFCRSTYAGLGDFMPPFARRVRTGMKGEGAPPDFEMYVYDGNLTADVVSRCIASEESCWAQDRGGWDLKLTVALLRALEAYRKSAGLDREEVTLVDIGAHVGW